MFCSLKNRIELQGEFFGTLLLLLVLKKTYILNVKLAFCVVADGVTHNACAGCTGADLVGIWGQVLQNSDSLMVLSQLRDRDIKCKMSSWSLLF